MAAMSLTKLLRIVMRYCDALNKNINAYLLSQSIWSTGIANVLGAFVMAYPATGTYSRLVSKIDLMNSVIIKISRRC